MLNGVYNTDTSLNIYYKYCKNVKERAGKGNGKGNKGVYRVFAQYEKNLLQYRGFLSAGSEENCRFSAGKRDQQFYGSKRTGSGRVHALYGKGAFRLLHDFAQRGCHPGTFPFFL